MPPVRQFLRVKRISFRDVFLLRRVDLADGKPFRLEDVVAVCRDCRRISKRGHWMMQDNTCPYCGCRETIPFQNKKDVTAGTEIPVVYSRGMLSDRRNKAFWAIAAALTVLLAIIIWPRGGGKAGFYADQDRFFYQDAAGQRYMDGAFEIQGKTYRFAEGYLIGESEFDYQGRRIVTDAAGRLRKGWQILDGKFAYADEKGIVKGKVPQIQSPGFYELEGLGTVYVGEKNAPYTGWLVHEGGLYHLENGMADPVDGLAGEFDAYGRYFPKQAGFVEGDTGRYYLDEDGELGQGLIAHEGFVYSLNEAGMLRRFVEEWELEGATAAQTGAMIPSRDSLVECAGGKVIVEARTGMLRRGWTLYEGALYCADADGYLLCSQSCRQPAGAFDANGRFLPDQPGRMDVSGVGCYVEKDGSLVIGARLEGEGLFLYDGAGASRINQQIGDIGVTDALGRLRPYVAGMYAVDGYSYCLSAQGQVLTGWQRCGKMYYFDPQTGRRVGAGILIEGKAYALAKGDYFAPTTEGVYQLGDAQYYVLTDGSLATGWRAVDGVLTYFDEQTGKLTRQPQQQLQKGWATKGGSRFYVGENGEISRGWQLIDNHVYYFDPQTGAALASIQQIDGKRYSFRADGMLQPDAPLVLMLNGEGVRIGENGSPEGGYLYNSGRLYYYDQKTARLSATLPGNVRGWISAMGGYIVPETKGVFAADKGSYYLDDDGEVLTGWFIRGGCLYYADAATGLLPEDGHSDQFAGTFSKGVFSADNNGIFSPDGRDFYFHQGQLYSGWVLLQNGVGYVNPVGGQLVKNQACVVDNIICQFDASGRYLPGKQMLITVHGVSRLLQADGSLVTRAGIYPMDRKLIAVREDGRIADSLAQLGIEDASLMLRQGVVIPLAEGIVTLGNNRYLLDQTGNFAIGMVSFQQKLYLFDTVTGAMRCNTQGFSETGEYRPFESGIIHLGSQAYYFLDTLGTLGRGLIETPHGDVYFADDQGRLTSAFVSYGGDKYYFSSATDQYTMVRSDFIVADDGTGTKHFYYADKDGKIVTGWQQINGALHYFDEEGRMLFDTIQDGKYINQYGEVI